MKGKTHDLNHDLTFSAHTINCVCHRIRSMFRVLGIYNFGLDLIFGLIQFVLIVKTIAILVKFGARFSWKYVMYIIKCYSVCVLDEQMKYSHYIMATFCFEFCFVLHFCLTKGYLFFLGRKYRVFCEPEYFTIIAFLRIFRVSIYAKQIDLPRTEKIFWHFLQFNWIYRVFPRIGDTRIITRSEMN